MPAPTGTTIQAKPDPTTEALRCLKSAFPRSQFSLAGGDIVAGNIMIATAQDIATKSLQAIVTVAAPRLKAAEEPRKTGA